MDDVLKQIKRAAEKEDDSVTNPLKFVNELVVGIYGQIADLEKEFALGVQKMSNDKVSYMTCLYAAVM
jgi:hypothetical protein